MKALVLRTWSLGVGAFFSGFFGGLENQLILIRVKRCVNTLFVVWSENGREMVADWSRVGREVRKSCSERQTKRMEEL